MNTSFKPNYALERSAFRAYGSSIFYSGTMLSTAGYALMLTTAVLFPRWRRKQVNQIWLCMCGSQLAWAIIDTIYYLKYYGCIAAPWLDVWSGLVTLVFFGNYFFLASCGWMLMGAWLSLKNIANGLTDTNEKFMIKASLFAWISPIPTGISAALATDTLKWENCIFVFLAKGHLQIWLSVVGSLCMYARVLWAVCRTRRASGRGRDVLGTTLLACVFVLISGAQYIMLCIYKYMPNHDVNKIILMLVKFVVISYDVFVYSVLFVVGIKQTRSMWCKYLCAKFECCNHDVNKGVNI